MKMELCDLCMKNSPDAKIKYKYKAKLFWWTWYKGGWKEIELCRGCLDKIIKAESEEGKLISAEVLDKIRAEIEQLPTVTRTNWNGCCPDIDYPEIEYIDVTKNKLLSILDKYKESEDKE